MEIMFYCITCFRNWNILHRRDGDYVLLHYFYETGTFSQRRDGDYVLFALLVLETGTFSQRSDGDCVLLHYLF